MVNFNLFSRINSNHNPSSSSTSKLPSHQQDQDETHHSKFENSSNQIHQTTDTTNMTTDHQSNRLLSKLRSISSSHRSSSAIITHPNLHSKPTNLLNLSPQAFSSHSTLSSPLPPTRSTSQSSTFSRFRKRASSLVKPNHHPQLISDSTIKTDDQLSYHLPPIDLQEELAFSSDQPITHSIQSDQLTPQINTSLNTPTLISRSTLTSSPLSFQNSSSQSNHHIMTPQSQSQSQPPPPPQSQSKLQPQPQSQFKSTPSIRSNNTIFSFRSKLRIGRRKKNDQASLHRQNSQNSLSTTHHHTNPSTSPKLTSSASLYTEPPSIKTPDFNKSQNSSGSSFQLKSFRNVRSTSSPGVPIQQSIPSTPTRQQTTPNQRTTNTQSSTPTPKATLTPSSTPTQSVRPAPVPLIQPTPSSPNRSHSRPASPSSSKRISAAAFREARQARTTSRSSLTSTYSDKPFLQYDPHQNNSQNRLNYWPPSSPTTNLYQGFSTPTPSMLNLGRAMSDIGLPTRHSHHSSGTPKPHSSDHGKRNITQPAPNSGRLSYYHNSKAFDNLGSHDHDADILIPPRPAFYGSSRSTHDRTNSSSSTPQFYKNPSSSQRSLASSQRSLPIHSQTRPISTIIKTPTKVKDSTLDKWHSDSDSEDDSNSQSQSQKNFIKSKVNVNEEDEDDEIPLSKLKKKSFNSLRESKSMISSSSKSTHLSQIPLTSITPNPKMPFLLNVTLPSTSNIPNNNNGLIQQQQQQQQYRGISPASSSSGGSGGPITPLDSSLAINLIRKEEELMLEKAPSGVDQFLYNGLTHEDKLQLHQRSQMMMQMIAAQAQMHAISLSNLNQPMISNSHLNGNFNRFSTYQANPMNSNGYRGSQSVIGINSELIEKKKT